MPWFVHNDVCACLEIVDKPQAAERLDEDEKGWVDLPTPGGKQRIRIVNESGLYKLAFRSKTESSKRFTREVTHEILPAIRKTGRFGAAPERTAIDLRDPAQRMSVLVQALQLLDEQTARADAAEATVEAQRPDVEFVERFVESDSLFGIREAAKTLGVNERDLIAWMTAKGYVTRLRRRLMPAHAGKERGYVVSKIEEWRNADGDTQAKPRAWITAKGMEHFGKKYDGPRKGQFALVVVK